MISDVKALKGVDVIGLFDNLDDAVKHDGSTWRYKYRNKYYHAANEFDKFFTIKIGEYSKSLNGKQSVIAHKSVHEIVKMHHKSRFILRLDVEKYYESIHLSHLKPHFIRATFSTKFIKHIELFYFDSDGFLKRGLRGSAMISELIGIKIDSQVSKVLYELGMSNIEYSRFYDDLLFSADERKGLRQIEVEVSKSVATLGLSVNVKKSKLTLVENSKILGLRIHDSKILVPKTFKRILRAREHHFKDEYAQTNWSDSDSIYELKRYTGRVIGSLWYIIQNSDEDDVKYREKIELYKETLGECDAMVARLREEMEEGVFY